MEQVDQQAVLTTLAAAGACLLASVDAQDRFAYVGPNWCSVGLSPTAGQSVSACFGTGAGAVARLLAAARAGEQATLDLCLAGPGPNGPRVVELQAVRVAGAAGWLALSGRDVTVAAARRAAAAAEQGLGRLAGGVAHDLNNHFLIIGGNLDMLGDDVPTGGESRILLDNAMHGVERATALVARLLELSTAGRGNPEPTNLARFVSELGAWLDAAVGRRHDVTVVCDAPALIVRADPFDLATLVILTVLAARSACPDGGAIAIECRCAAPSNAGAELVVRNRGGAVADEADRAILGLLAARNGGTIDYLEAADSAPAVRIRLPAA